MYVLLAKAAAFSMARAMWLEDSSSVRPRTVGELPT